MFLIFVFFKIQACVFKRFFVHSHFGSSHSVCLAPELLWIAMAGLSWVLEQIYEAQIPLSEQRLLATRAVAQRSGAPQSEMGLVAITHMEEVLTAVGKKVGKGRINVTEAKQWLRSFGKSGAELASRLSRLSKSRNLDAHPVVGLVKDIMDMPGHLESSTTLGGKDVDKSMDKEEAKAAIEDLDSQAEVATEDGDCTPVENKEAATLGEKDVDKSMDKEAAKATVEELDSQEEAATEDGEEKRVQVQVGGMVSDWPAKLISEGELVQKDAEAADCSKKQKQKHLKKQRKKRAQLSQAGESAEGCEDCFRNAEVVAKTELAEFVEKAEWLNGIGKQPLQVRLDLLQWTKRAEVLNAWRQLHHK